MKYELVEWIKEDWYMEEECGIQSKTSLCLQRHGAFKCHLIYDTHFARVTLVPFLFFLNFANSFIFPFLTFIFKLINTLIVTFLLKTYTSYIQTNFIIYIILQENILFILFRVYEYFYMFFVLYIIILFLWLLSIQKKQSRYNSFFSYW